MFDLLLTNPASRIYWLYLLASLVLALWFWAWKGMRLNEMLLRLFSRDNWLSRSTWVDIQWLMINYGLKVSLVLPVIGGQYGLALWLNQQLFTLWGEGNFILWDNTIAVSLIFTLSLFLVDDFSRFYLHRLYHRIPFLWRFHAVHHSADRLTPLTLYRIHCLEMLINSTRSVLVNGLVSGLFLYSFRADIGLMEIMGVNAFIFCFNLMGANLRHSSVWLGFGRLEYLFISPAQHQIHHSAALRHHNKNMGSALAIWDVLFGSHLTSQRECVDVYGLSQQKLVSQSLFSQLWGIPYSKAPQR